MICAYLQLSISVVVVVVFFFFDIYRSLDEIEAAVDRCSIQEQASKSKGLYLGATIQMCCYEHYGTARYACAVVTKTLLEKLKQNRNRNHFNYNYFVR